LDTPVPCTSEILFPHLIASRTVQDMKAIFSFAFLAQPRQMYHLVKKKKKKKVG
jgi:hypothetical protein